MLAWIAERIDPPTLNVRLAACWTELLAAHHLGQEQVIRLFRRAAS